MDNEETKLQIICAIGMCDARIENGQNHNEALNALQDEIILIIEGARLYVPDSGLTI